MTSLETIPFQTMTGETRTLGDWPGQVRLVVNVASRCGLSPQYAKLEELQRRYADRGFTVLGFPSNQFFQELSSNDEIAEYCSATWGVTFPILDRVRVNGRRAHPLFTELKRSRDSAGLAGPVVWNFEKFLVLPSGEVRRFRPPVEPDDPAIVQAIEAGLAESGRADAAAGGSGASA
ncbi:Hydroperoxy fatty acid reductase gpx1 [Agromyces sp. NDB4Y10]|jgi:glutathione peroxidase|uniref:glutathione peroxidase n=1 Tax=Agromyces sp. NDB4Y10 TaxID=1775951 RepID=UPI0007B26A5B|nr:glutathione peroxidase [Agromyces sp. NDB4Y10]KZE93880.1 Hydroperoxy fatty acid reductase gpx1 [Agromyces sp. NDB4Y10]